MIIIIANIYWTLSKHFYFIILLDFSKHWALLLAKKLLKTHQTYYMNIFQDTAHEATKERYPWEMENIWGRPYNFPSLLTWEVFPATEQGGGNLGLPQETSWVERTKMRVVRSGSWSSHSGVSERSESTLESHRDSCLNTCMWRDYWDMKKRTTGNDWRKL